ncbi:protein kinase domain-containing protein [Tengunoibacter tsumagoiensis]|uniref:Protein kinase domain-containing protein n=1 Tax=Tengunoibacter tsumagoiensis TaxID=2014871 RepID=A0A402A3E6_9CHLR|nr:protein kinase [Tengunoibacter tsumagoiensis]GCE13677.1 hypothetical protein KTT_35360 [Tengunoibacter tsumagoiensis]
MGQAGGPRICGNCGTSNAAADQFCSNCGYALDSVPTSYPTIQGPASNPFNQPTIQATSSNSGASGGRRITGAFLPGNMLGGRYRVVQMIGKGGFGAVYQARDERFQSKRVVAIKEMSDAQLSANEKARAIQDFRNEAELLVELNHPNLPNVSDFFEEAGKAYLVMEFVEGKTLEAKQAEANAPLNEQLVMGWALQLCGVLHYLHTRPRPIIFRDMKPANVMVTNDGQIKLIDFGIARIFKAAGTKDTTLLGSQGYAPLEQYGRGQSDARSDIYALGATLYDLLTKEVPADSPSRRVQPAFFVPPRQINPQLSQPTEAIVLKAMAEDPQDRYQSAAEMYEAIADSGITTTSHTLLSRGNTGPNMPTILAGNTRTTTGTQVATASHIPSGPSAQPQKVTGPAQGQMMAPPPSTTGSSVSRRAFLIGGAVVVGAAAVGGTAIYLANSKNKQTQNGSGTTIKLQFTYSTEKKDWISQAITTFNQSNTQLQGKTIEIMGDQQGSGDAKNQILNGSLKPIIWSPASTLEINQLNLHWKTQHTNELTISSGDYYPRQLVYSPLVFAIWHDRAQLLKRKYTSLDWKSIHDALQLPSWGSIDGGQTSWGQVKLGQTRPDQSNSGLLSITLIAYSYYNRTRSLTTDNIQDPGFIKYFQEIEDAVLSFGRSSGTYLQNEVIQRGPAVYDIIPIYENLVITNIKQSQSLQGQLLQPFYPDVNIISDHPFAILNGDWVTDEQKQAAKIFRDFLLSDNQQRQALLSGFRPANQSIKLTDSIANNPFTNKDVSVPTDISNQAQPPNGDVVDALLKLWTDKYNSAATALSQAPALDKGSQVYERIV